MTWLLRIIAILLCVATLDVAATAIHGPQAVLLACVAAAGLAILSVAVLWTWASVAAGLALLWLTSAFAANTVLLGSPEASGSVAFTGLTPADSAALVLILVLCTAAILGIATFRSLALRLVIALVALYALAPIAMSVGHGGLRTAMTGGALAPLRGAYVGVIALAVAAVIALGAALFFLVKRRGVKAATALVLACAVVLASGTGAYVAAASGLPSYVAFNHAPAGVEAASTQQTGAAETLVRFARAAPPEDFDLAAREKQLTTADAAFAYVRDAIAFEPYSGVLRGPTGTFLTHAGNALDRAMLLAHILQTNNTPVRYVTGHLAAPQAELLFARAFEPKAVPALPSAPANSAAKAFRDRVLARGSHDYDLLRTALGSNVPAAAFTTRDDAVKEIVQHAWIQAQLKGQWVDLDPSFADAAPGHAYTTVEQTYNELPSALMQQVIIRVTTETLRDGKLVKDVALESTTPAYKLLDRQVFLGHSRPAGMQGLLSAKDQPLPQLVVSGVATSGKPIAFSAGASAAATEAPSGIQSAIGALGGSTGAGNTAFVAEVLEFDVVFPDGHHDTMRRTLADRASTAWRRGATLDPAGLKDLPRNKDGVIAAQALYNLSFSAGKHDLPTYSQSARTLLDGEVPRFESKPPEKLTFNEQAWPFAMRGFGWFIASDHLIVPSLNDTPGLRFYADSPRIFVFNMQPKPGGGDSSVTIESDLRRDTLRALARDASAQSAVAQHRLHFGALEGALEHEMSTTGVASTLATTSKLSETGGVTVYRPGSNGSVAAKDPETAARLRSALDAGDTVIVPDRVLAGGVPGWWEITRGAGDARPVLDELGGSTYETGGGRIGRPSGGLPPNTKAVRYGSNQQQTGGNEYLTLVKAELEAAPAYVQVGLLVGEVAAFVAAVLAAAGAF
jgi:transglutaminase-like putative cysteine protease